MIGMFTLTGELDGLGGTAATGHVIVSATPSAIKDGDGNRTFVSPKRVWLRDGKFTVTLPTDATSGVSSAIRYRVTSNLRRGLSDIDISFWAPAVGTSVDLSEPTAPAAPPSAPGDTFTIPFTIPFTVGA